MVIVVNPPFFYGPFAPGWSNPEGSRSALSTNAMLYDLLCQDGPLPKRPTYIDVRDVARSLVNALDAPSTSQVGRKRILMTGEWFSAYEAVGYLSEVRPELRERMSKEAKRPTEKPVTKISNARAKEVLRLDEVTPWRKSVIDAVDDLVKLEAELAARGIKVPV